LEEDFTQIVFRFTNDANRALLRLASSPCEPDANSAMVFEEWEERVRHRSEQPLGLTESILNNEAMDNVDADVLASLYNPQQPTFFCAYIRGRKHHDLRLYIRYRGGAIPQFDSPEEVALVNFAHDSLDDGIFYMQHLKREWDLKSASSNEDRRFFSVRKYTIDTYITRNNHLAATAKLDLEPLIPGERVIKFHLLPDLRVLRVLDARDKELYAVQQGRKEDGSFYVILNSPAQLGTAFTLQIEYEGNKVVSDAGEGSFYVRARECWYPTPNQFNERSLYDLTFHIPKQYKIISVGNLEQKWAEDQYTASHWVTPSPIAIAGFNYGDYKMLQLADNHTGTAITGYYLHKLPDTLRGDTAVQSLAPESMTKHILEIARAQIQLCNYYFGPDGFDHIDITEQPDFSFGQSWPSLLYMPISAYMDATQRWMLLGKIDNRLSAFIQEVAPHEVAHQWWGHAVGWASYHDQWLSEGFAEFSAALFVQNAQGPDWQNDYRVFWARLQRRILEKGQFGAAPNDAGPIWLGARLESPRNASAYQTVVYAKGAYVLSMLRSLMYTNKDHDKDFIAMMHDFVATSKGQLASTESFRSVVRRHMTPALDLAHNGTMDWFFNEWVYGTEIPKYQFAYQVTPIGNGHSKLAMTVTQADVSNSFRMAVPVFVELDKGRWVRIGQIAVLGDGPQTITAELPMVPKSVKMDPFNEILHR
ncbi:MAG TPA: M1 family aminopeptidase, partial [Bryobacteraceae bacterium]|nr:M1 family aminopeptidase [Bryobacteraceae bacterium]